MPDTDPPHLETTAVTAGRSSSRDSLAPVLFPSTTYAVDTVAEQAEMVASARPQKLYSRFGSPTVREFEDAVAALEGAEAALASASGMASVTAVAARPLLLRRPHRGHAADLRRHLRPARHAPASLRHRRHPRRRHRRRCHRRGHHPRPDAGGPRRDAGQPGAEPRRPRRRRRHLRSDHRRRLDVRHARSAAAARPRRRPRAALGDEGHRWSQRLAPRRSRRQRRPHRSDLGVAVGHGRPGVAVRRLERHPRHPHPAGARPAAERVGSPAGDVPRRAPGRRLGVVSVPAQPPPARSGPPADADWRHRHRGRRWRAGPPERPASSKAARSPGSRCRWADRRRC